MTIHITGLGVEGRKGVCIYECRRDRIPIGNSSYKKKNVMYRYYKRIRRDYHGVRTCICYQICFDPSNCVTRLGRIGGVGGSDKRPPT